MPEAPAAAALNALMDPRSVAVVGASSNPDKAGGRPLQYMVQTGYEGALYPVNPNRAEILSLRAYPSLADLPETPDVCVIAVPVDRVEDYIVQCGELGIRSAIVFASGYAETGREGLARQERLRAIALANGMALAGPNCLGMLNARTGAAPTFTTALERGPMLAQGPIAFVSQSGAVGAFLLGMIQDAGLGITHFVTTGNEAVLDLADYISYLLEDAHTRAIAGYLEGADGARLVEVAKNALARGKPLVLMKVGASRAGAAASAAHTGKLAGVDAVYDAVFRRYAVTRARSLEELLDFSRSLSMSVLPAGAGVGIVSTSGGAGILLADWCERLGLDVVDLAPETVERLRLALPWFAGRRNPVDTTGRPLWEPEMMHDALRAVAQDPGVDVILCHVGLAPGPGRRIADELVRAANAVGKPVLVCWLREVDPEPHARLGRSGIPVFSDPVRMARAASVAVSYVRSRGVARDRTVAPTIAVVRPVPGGPVVAEHDARRWLVAHGLTGLSEELARSAADAVAAAERIGYPVCLKLVSPDVPHRSDIGGVRLGLAAPEEVERAYDEILASAGSGAPQARIDGVLVTEQVTEPGVELIVSGFRDQAFGPCVLCGIGGVLAEVMRDTVIRPAPVDREEARAMLSELRGAALLQGARGARVADVGAAASAIVLVSELIAGVTEDVETIEINPLLVLGEGRGIRVLDALVTRKAREAHGRAR